MSTIDAMNKVTLLCKTCGACPAQWEGELDDGRCLYIRYRHGHLRVGVGKTVDAAIDAAMGRGELAPLLSVEVSDRDDGWLDLSELKTLTSGVLDFSVVDGTVVAE